MAKPSKDSTSITYLTKKDSQTKACSNPVSSPLATPSNTSTSSTTTTASLSTSTAVSITPTSDCSSLKTNVGTYLVPANTAETITRNVQFNITCGSDYKLPLVLAMRTYRFEDCINACASHATNAQDPSTACVVAVYKPDSQQPLTCWLKSTGPEGPIPNLGVDSARISDS